MATVEEIGKDAQSKWPGHSIQRLIKLSYCVGGSDKEEEMPELENQGKSTKTVLFSDILMTHYL